MPSLENALYGPVCGDAPVASEEVEWAPRPGREWKSRLVNRPKRQTRTVTVIGGPYQGEPCVLYTIFGGPASPKEVFDPSLTDEERSKSVKFWMEHALAM